MTSVRTGSWSDPATWSIGQVPAVNDRVSIAQGTTVTYDRQSDADIVCINVAGQLTFRTDTSTRLTVGTLTVMPTGGLQIGSSATPVASGVTAEIVVSDRPIDTGLDPEQYGTGILGFGRVTMHGAVKSPTFVRLSAEVGAGQASLSLASPATGWQPGDKLVVPGTNQSSSDGDGYQGQWETPTLASASGSSLALTSGLAFAHRGGRDAAGALAFLPHVGNISRNIIIRSQNPNGTRGHVLLTDRAEVDIRYAAFKDLGRTLISPLDSATLDASGHATHIGSNQIGRYSLHLHHLFGPAAPPPNSYQYVLIGNAIDGGTKWGITIHDTHYGLVQDNVVYNAAGAGIMTEDGSETANVIQNNFIVRAWGTGHERADGRQGIGDWGWEGSGIWLRGPDNIVRNNVIANSNAYAVTYMMLGVSSVLVPNAPGDDPRVSGHAVNMMAVALRDFSSNEFYSTHRGITTWNLGANCCTEVYDVPVSTFFNTRMWHVGRFGFYGYGENRVTFDGWVHYNDPASLSNTFQSSASFYFGDYIARNIVIRHADIQGLRVGVFAPIKAGDTRDIYGTTPGTLLIENSSLKNYWNIYMTTPYGVTGGGVMIPGRLVIARNVQFSNVPGVSDTQGQSHVFRHFTPAQGTNPNIVVSDRAVVESFNGNSADSFEVFSPAQAGSFVIPSTDLTTRVAGMTNTQAWTTAGVAISGAVTPCTTSRPGIVGFTCPPGALPSLPTGPTSPQPAPPPPPPPGSNSGGGTGSGGINDGSCHTPDPFVSLGGGTCYSGGWYPPNMPIPDKGPAPSPGNGSGSGTGTANSCSTPDPFVSLGGGVCVNGGWLPPGMRSTATSSSTPVPVRAPTSFSTPPPAPSPTSSFPTSLSSPSPTSSPTLFPVSPSTSSRTPSPATSNRSTGCSTADPFANLGGGTCSNGNWYPPSNPLPLPIAPAATAAATPAAPVTSAGTGCSGPDPFVSLGGGTCANGTWSAPMTTSPATARTASSPKSTPGACPGPDPFGSMVGLVGICANGGWVPVLTTANSPSPSLSPITADDSDGDGVANSSDQCPGTAVGMTVDARGCPIVSSTAPPPKPANTIVVNPGVKYQVMTGWEVAIPTSITDFKSFSTAQLGAILDVTVNELGVTRARVSIDSGAENPTDWGGQYVDGLITNSVYRAHSYEIVNDNADPNVINLEGFNFSLLDYQIDRLIVPMRQRAAARGESVYLNLTYVDFGESPFEHYAKAEEYAEFMLAVFQHMKSKYRFVPNAIEVMLEPNEVNGWSGTRLGQAIVATAAKLKANGFAVPDFVAPSTSSVMAAPKYFDEIISVPGALALVKELSYHRYAADLTSLEAIAARAVQYGVRTSMLEYWSGNNNYLQLHQDLTVARNSSWQVGVFADAFSSPHALVHLVNGVAQPSSNAKLLRQYTKYVRPGAQRIEASSANASFDPIAFVNVDGRYAVVVKADREGSFSVSGLPGGTYGVSYTTNSRYDVNLADVTIGSGQSLSTSIPAAGVVTIYKK